MRMMLQNIMQEAQAKSSSFAAHQEVIPGMRIFAQRSSESPMPMQPDPSRQSGAPLEDVAPGSRLSHASSNESIADVDTKAGEQAATNASGQNDGPALAWRSFHLWRMHGHF